MKKITSEYQKKYRNIVRNCDEKIDRLDTVTGAKEEAHIKSCSTCKEALQE